MNCCDWDLVSVKIPLFIGCVQNKKQETRLGPGVHLVVIEE